MSASSKKKLRKELEAQKLTEKQQQAQKESKKLKVTTIAFVAILLAIVVAFAVILTVNTIKTSGVIEKNTVAATVGEHELNSIEFNYYYNDLVSNTYNEWTQSYGQSLDAYMAMMGLDLTKPLNEQNYFGEEGTTWAEYFVDYALNKIASDYAMYDAAVAAGFTLSEEDQKAIENNMSTMALYAQIYGYTDLDHYLTMNYGAGANEKSYTEYCTKSAIATAYYNAYGESLSYDNAAIREHDAKDAVAYNAYDYAYYYVNVTNFLHKDVAEDHDHSAHTAEENEAARKQAKEAADSLRSAKTVEELDAAIAALSINEGKTVASNKSTGVMGAAISSLYKSWLTSASRTENDLQVFASESTTKDEDGKETTVVNGYYVVMFQGVNTNERPVGNVRHLLVTFKKGEDGKVTAKAKEDAKAKADEYLKMWQDGAKTEESFIELVKKYSEDSSATTGGLFENVTPVSNYVDNFLNWSINETRQAGDTEVIETEYGYHVMYYVGASELNYRDMMISDDLRADDLQAWYESIVGDAKAELVSDKFVKTDLILAPAK